jgi:hypothetical protein
MKKIAVILLAVLLVFVMSSGAFAAFSLKLGYEPTGTLNSVYHTNGINLSVSDSRAVAGSFSLGGETTRRTVEGLIYGVGAEYQFYRQAEGGNTNFSFIPVYGMVRGEFPVTRRTRSFIFGRVGYNFYQEANPTDGYNLHGGLYYAAGVGLILTKTTELQLMYSCNNGEASSSYLNVQHAYSKYSLGLGVKL